MPTLIGKRMWVIPEGWIPADSTGPEESLGPEGTLTSHEAACMLNVTDDDANVEIVAYFPDRAPAGPYSVRIPAKRTLHLRFNDLDDPEPIPRDTAYSTVIESDRPIVVQHTRLDSRMPPHAVLSTIAYPAD